VVAVAQVGTQEMVGRAETLAEAQQYQMVLPVRVGAAEAVEVVTRLTVVEAVVV
jgi:hypothetical protein